MGHLAISANDLVRMLEKLMGTQVVVKEQIHKGSNSACWLVATDAGEHVLKASSSFTPIAHTLAAQRAARRFVSASDARPVHHIWRADLDRPISITVEPALGRLDGTKRFARFSMSERRRSAKMIGRSLAKFHTAEANDVASITPQRQLAAMTHALNRVGLGAKPENVDVVRRALHALAGLEATMRQRFESVLTHRDLHLGNLIINSPDVEPAYVDFEDAANGDPFMDWTTFVVKDFRYQTFMEPERCTSEILACPSPELTAFIEGYDEVRELPANWRERLHFALGVKMASSTLRNIDGARPGRADRYAELTEEWMALGPQQVSTMLTADRVLSR